MKIAKYLMSVVLLYRLFNLLIRTASELLIIFHNDRQAENSCTP